MDDLFKKVSKGSFQRLPKEFSNELQAVLALCLKKKAKERPECIEIVAKVAQIKDDLTFLTLEEEEPELMQTITIPKNLKLLSLSLPQPNYQKLKTTSMDKQSFFQSYQ